MASYRLLHVVRDGSGDTNGLAEYTNSDTVLLPVHSSDPSESNEGAMIYNSSDNKIKIYDGSAWVVVGNTSEQIQDIVAGQLVTNGTQVYEVTGVGASNATGPVGTVLGVEETVNAAKFTNRGTGTKTPFIFADAACQNHFFYQFYS